jgi:hypothetical protein
MIKISEKTRKNTLYISIICYFFTLISIGYYFMNFDNSYFKMILSIIELLIFPIWFILIIYLQNDYRNINKLDSYSFDVIKFFNSKTRLLIVITLITLMVSFFSFFLGFINSANGVPIIENGQYILRNHSIITYITKEEFYELTRIQNIVSSFHLLAFYIIPTLLLDKKDLGLR